MRSGSDLARASALAEFFEHCTRATEHILATTQEPIAKRMRAIEAERLLKQDSVNFTSCSKPDETTHSVTRDLHGIEARCIDLAAAVLLPLLDTKIRRRAEVELTKQQEWDAIQTHAKEKGLSFNERILELIDDFVAWLTLAWKTDDWPCAAKLRNIRNEAESSGSSRAVEIDMEIRAIRMLLSLHVSSTTSQALAPVSGPSQTKKRRSRPRGAVRPSADSSDDSSRERKPKRLSRKRHDKATPAEASTTTGTAAQTSYKETQELRLTESFKKVQRVVAHLSTLDVLLQEVPFENRVLQKLYHENLDSREDAIQAADANTFMWLLDESVAPHLDESRLAARQSLLEWLEKGSGVYHISGKPGSGKSTLFKLIANKDCSKKRLRSWAGDHQLVVATFYFWNSGDQLQTSLEGLQRSILLQVLKQVPGWTATLFKLLWDKHFKDGIQLDQVILTYDCITQAWDTLMSGPVLNSGTRHLCLLIDGLDEMTGSGAVTFSFLAEFFSRATANTTNLKICVSSRPFQEFLQGFDSAQRLHLHELTAEDIRTTVTKTIFDLTHGDTGEQKLTEIGQQLVNTIVEKSEGVFIWVHMALQQIRTMAGAAHKGLINEPVALTESMLAQMVGEALSAYPSDIDALYGHLLTQLSEDERQAAIVMLSLVKENPYRQLPNALWFYWLDELQRNPDFPALGLGPYTAQQVRSFHEQVEVKLESLAKSLLKMYTDRRERKDGDRFYRKRVQFCHRTARDFFDSAQAAGKFVVAVDFDSPGVQHGKHSNASGAAEILMPIFVRLRLAEVVLAGKFRDAPGADPRRRRIYSSLAQSLFSHSHPRGGMYQVDFSYIETLRKDLETTQREKFGSAYLVCQYQGVSRLALTSEDPEKAASFLHYTQYIGQWDYLKSLSKLSSGNPDAVGTSSILEKTASKSRSKKSPGSQETVKDDKSLHMMITMLFGWLLRRKTFGEVSMKAYEERLPDMGDLMGWVTVKPPISYDFLADTSYKASIPMVFSSVALFLGGDRTNTFLEYLARGLRGPLESRKPGADFSALNFIFLLEKNKDTPQSGVSPTTPTYQKPRRLLTRRVPEELEKWITLPIRNPAGDILMRVSRDEQQPGRVNSHPCGVSIQETHYTTFSQLVGARVLLACWHELTTADTNPTDKSEHVIMRFLDAMPADDEIAETVLDSRSELYGNLVLGKDLEGWTVTRIVSSDGLVLEEGGDLCVRVF